MATSPKRLASLPSLAHLRVLAAVAQHGSATRAAAALFRAQSAVTRSIREIEQALGEPLLERRATGMVPTAVGRAVLDRNARVFGELEDLASWCAAGQPRARTAVVPTVPSYLLNTRRLQLLVALARHRHMPTAAHALGISQPAVSAAIRILESGAGFPLFDRTTSGLQPTEAGEQFVLQVRRALNELRHIPDDIAAVKGSIRGQVVVGGLPFARTRILPEAVARVSRSHPGVRVVTDESAYEILAADLRAGDVDFIFGGLRAADMASGFRSERLMSEAMVVLARSDHPLAASRGLALARLGRQQWILPRAHTPARTILDDVFARARVRTPEPAVETADLAMIRGLLLRTDMLAILPAQQLHYECQTGSLAVLDIALPGTERDIGLTLRTTGEPSPAARTLIEAIRGVVAEMAAAAT
ncbi:MAG: LysR family transcriptional regulator [Pigmentiphaga sp.]|uniref:LysR family transcriptional regulator n=1 Tax=Pigmentiphaga TaxID=152267 RepID=UPI0031D12C02